jgi:hypothetical protein
MKKLSVLIGIIIVTVSLSGCGKNYLDINTPNPNAATSATPQLVITSAMTATAQVEIADNLNAAPTTNLNGWMGYWAISGSYAQSNTDPASYYQTTEYGNNLWIYDYRNLEDYYYVETSAKTLNQPYYEAMAKVMKSVVFQELVDGFNNIPYTQDFQGTILIQPKYDSAQAIYEDLAKQCDSAVTLMASPAAVAAAHTDIMFNGDFTLWQAFANTLKLRILMRQTQMSGRGAYITAEIAKILANGAGFLTQDAAINPPYANNAGQQNPLWGYFVLPNSQPTSGGQADFWRANSYSLTVLKALNDPRLPFLYTLNSSGAYTGSVFGNATNPPGNGTSSIGPGLLQSVSQNAIIQSAAESYFLQAEAIVRGYMTGDAKAAYQAGVQASFDFLGAGDATAYYSQAGNTKTTWDAAVGTAGQIALIIQQKWIAENGVLPNEAYADYRRTGLPNIPISTSIYKVTNNIPTRYLYPVSEYTTNTANVDAQGTIDPGTSKVFWNQ